MHSTFQTLLFPILFPYAFLSLQQQNEWQHIVIMVQFTCEDIKLIVLYLLLGRQAINLKQMST